MELTWEMCLKIYEIDPAKFISAPGLAWKAALKKTKVMWDILTDIDMLIMVQKGIRGGICHSIYQYEKGNKKYMKDYDKNKETCYLFNIGMKVIYMDGQCRKSFQ